MERQRLVEAAETKCREFERHLERAEMRLADIGGELANLCPPLSQLERRALLEGLRTLAPDAVRGAVQVVAARVGIDEVRLKRMRGTGDAAGRSASFRTAV